MIKDIQGAIEEEKLYVADRMNAINTSLPDRLQKYGYDSLTEYFAEKTEYLFNEWKPEVFRINEDFLDTEMEKVIVNGDYGIYIIAPTGTYAFHGNDVIDYDLCNKLDVRVIEMGYSGGTIIGSDADLGILLVMPKNIGFTNNIIMNKFHDIISKRIDNVTIIGNDILVDGEKVLGSMTRNIGDSWVWAALASFGEYSELISKICNKPTIKKPSYIDSSLLTRDELEKGVLSWLLQKL